MNFLLDAAKEYIVVFVEHFSKECAVTSGWLRANDLTRWNRTMDDILGQLITDDGAICISNEVWQHLQDQIRKEARNLWVSQLSQEHFDTAMVLFRDGVIDGLQVPYGEILTCFEFTALWDEHRKRDDKEGFL